VKLESWNKWKDNWNEFKLNRIIVKNNRERKKQKQNENQLRKEKKRKKSVKIVKKTQIFILIRKNPYGVNRPP